MYIAKCVAQVTKLTRASMSRASTPRASSSGTTTPRSSVSTPRAPTIPSVDANRYGAVCKIVLIGEAGVGKTEFTYVVCDDSTTCRKVGLRTLLPSSSTIGVDFQTTSRSASLGSTDVKFQLWDTAGTERYQSLTRAYLNGATAYIVCYDVTNLKTLECVVTRWMPLTRDYNENPIVYLLGTKTDLVLPTPKIIPRTSSTPARVEANQTRAKSSTDADQISIETPRADEESDLMRRVESQPKMERQVNPDALAHAKSLFASKPGQEESFAMLDAICGCYETNTVFNNGNDAYDTFTKIARDIIARLDSGDNVTLPINTISMVKQTSKKKKSKCSLIG
jgi:small GTP-binding protein